MMEFLDFRWECRRKLLKEFTAQRGSGPTGATYRLHLLRTGASSPDDVEAIRRLTDFDPSTRNGFLLQGRKPAVKPTIKVGIQTRTFMVERKGSMFCGFGSPQRWYRYIGSRVASNLTCTGGTKYDQWT